MKKILVSKRRGIGDSILMTPAIETLHRNFPEAEITVLVPQHSAAIFRAQPGVTRIWTFEEKNPVLRTLEIAAQRFDAYFDLNCTGQTKWMATLSCAKMVVSHRHDPATLRRYKTRPNGIDWDMFALQDSLPNLSVVPRELQRPKFYLYREEVLAAEAFWAAKGVRSGNVVVLGTGATRPTKRWPSLHFARFVELLRQRLNMAVAILVGPGEADRVFANQVIHDMKALQLDSQSGFIVERVQNLRTYAALLAKSYAYVGNDSGPKHIAAAVGTPTLTFFGPEDPVEWHPYPEADHPYLFKKGLACRREDNGRWCGIEVCTVEQHKCMKQLTPDDAFKAFLTLGRKPIVHDLPLA